MSMVLTIIQGVNSVVAQEVLVTDELSTILSGKTWIIMGQTGGDVRVTWRSDGTYCTDSESGRESQTSSLCGTWRQEQEKFCFGVKDQGTDECFRVVRAGIKKFNALNDLGNVDFSWSMR
tara:strand:- start:556 stop:915 length:360 start_codon:yes stop_codon:yes gene_type:complete